MCRWLAYSGAPILIEKMLFDPANSIVVQSLDSKLGATRTNGDGFGVGWYGEGHVPALYKTTSPAWNDRNLRELSRQIRSHLVFAHVRAATGTPVQQTNCHPFRHGKWMWMHNGVIAEFDRIKRDLLLAIDPDLFCAVEGSTDSEVFFFLALTFGLDQDPIGAVQRAVKFIEDCGRRLGIEFPMQMTVGVTDGRSIWAFRYASAGTSRTLFVSCEPEKLRTVYPENQLFQELSKNTRLIVSEPLSEMEGVWTELPESSCTIVTNGKVDVGVFAPVEAGR